MKCKNSPELFSRFKQLRKQTKKCIAASYHQYRQSLSEKLKADPKKFWSYHAIKTNTRTLPAVDTYKNRSVSDPADKAALFNTFFSTVYASNAISSGDLTDDVIHPNLLMKISTTQEEVEDILLRLNVHKASGVDGIPARSLKIYMYAEALSWPFTYLFNLSFTLAEVPLIWKMANITPVFKTNTMENVENYRSISVLSILGKCQERIVHRVIYSHVSPFLNNRQHGFVKGRSCITQLFFLRTTCGT